MKRTITWIVENLIYFALLTWGTLYASEGAMRVVGVWVIFTCIIGSIVLCASKETLLSLQKDRDTTLVPLGVRIGTELFSAGVLAFYDYPWLAGGVLFSMAAMQRLDAVKEEVQP